MRLAAAALLACCINAQTVTDTKWVENWENGKGRTELRKINRRWWTQDNREVTPPGQGQVFWTPDSRPGTCVFYHHRPVQIARAESLHLFMSPQDVEAVLGQPNRTMERDGHGFWWYYAANGTKLTVRFMGGGGLGEASYSDPGGKSRPVTSVVNDLGGRDLYKVFSERARAKNQQPIGTRRGSWPSVATVDPVPVAPAQPAPPKHIVSAEAYAAVAVGASRQDLLERLGEPTSRYAITDDDGTHESFTYDLDNGETVVIRLLSGKVTKVR